MVTRQAELFRALAEDLALEILTSYTEDDFEEPRWRRRTMVYQSSRRHTPRGQIGCGQDTSLRR